MKKITLSVINGATKPVKKTAKKPAAKKALTKKPGGKKEGSKKAAAKKVVTASRTKATQLAQPLPVSEMQKLLPRSTNNQKSLEQKVVDIVFDNYQKLYLEEFKLDPNSINPETSFADLAKQMQEDDQASLLSKTMIAFDLEDEFKISIPDRDVENWKTIAGAIAYIKKYI